MPVIILTKSDLCDDLENKLSEVSSVAFGIDVLVTTSTEENGYKELLPLISEGKTIAFIGSSGVGKSTLINRLLGKERLKTNGLRNDDKGRHTTTRRELFLLPSGGMVIDTPGMRELGMWDNDDGIERTFRDIEELLLSVNSATVLTQTSPDVLFRKHWKWENWTWTAGNLIGS